MKNLIFAAAVATLIFPAGIAAQTGQSRGVVVEEIITRVNNDIVTLSDYQKANQTLKQEIGQECQGCTQDKMETEYKERQKDLLRDLIDQDLLIQRAKDMGITVEADVVKQLDDVRKKNNLTSMEDLEKAVEGEGLSWEEYKTQMRNNLLTQEVIRKEVGSRIDIGNDEVKKYYEDHKQEFNRPEQVVLAELLLSTDGKTPEEIAAVQKKADDLLGRVKKGEEFSELAKRYSEGSTGKEGGPLGTFERGQLDKQLEDEVFKLDKGQVTEVIQTKSGFEILKIVDHYQVGLQPLDKVETEIMNRIYMKRMQPTLRTFLAELREESYVMVKPGYTDSAAVAGASLIQEVAPSADAPQKNKKKGLPKGKVSGS
jgi:peptidyl-prolyl cis-trans isomerase SurA